jgi:hypothetical protein
MPKSSVGGEVIAQSKVEGGIRRLRMFIVKVAYDAYNQQFRLIDQKLANMFEDGDVYLLVVDFFPQQSEAEDQFINLNEMDIGHA